MRRPLSQILVLILLLTWYGLFFSQRINLTTADIGRHLRNGEFILKGQLEVLKTNFYSYTEPNFPFLNHHWGSGVIFYLVWKVFGFVGLSLFYLLLSLVVFYLFFVISEQESSFFWASLVSLLLIPLMAARREIRPEIFTYLFTALFFFLLFNWKKEQIKQHWLYLLPVLQIIWVNTHIFFFFGPILIGLFWLEQIVSFLFNKTLNNKEKRKEKIKILGVVLLITTLVTFINPFGLRIILYPLNMLNNYGYQIVENKSVWFLENWGFRDPNLRLFEISLVVLWSSFIIVWLRNKKNFSFFYLSLAVLFSFLGWLAIRNFTMFAFFALPIICFNLNKGLTKEEQEKLKSGFALLTLAFFVFLLNLATQYQRLPFQSSRFGFGLMKGVNGSANFFQQNKLKGPIFNNYDIGGYLIFHLFPQERVFTDNRPEAYSVSHFQEQYIPAQQDQKVWQQLNQQHNFNTIFFYYRDYTPWSQEFLINKVNDPQWVPIYADPYAIIFVKRNQTNQQLIEKFEIPKQNFRVIPQK
jgi:hypothetical protein